MQSPASDGIDPNGLEPAEAFAYQVRMSEPSLHSSRLALAAGLSVTLLVAGAGFLLGRVTTERVPPAAAPVAAASPQPTPEPAPSRGVLGRADLIALAASAADAAAAGRDPAPADMDGRRFELRLPFGCAGPAEKTSKAAMRWRYDSADSALRLHVAPVSWAAADWWPNAAPPGVGTIGGFWIARPWTSSEACPAGEARAAPIDADPVTLPGHTLALGQVFSADGGRGDRRGGEAYEAVVRVSEDELDTSAGFRVRITGRIARLPNARSVRCQQPAGPEQRPICLVGAVMDEVAIENAANDEVLARWSVSQPETPEG